MRRIKLANWDGNKVDYYITCNKCGKKMRVSALWALRLIEARYCLQHLPLDFAIKWRLMR